MFHHAPPESLVRRSYLNGGFAQASIAYDRRDNKPTQPHAPSELASIDTVEATALDFAHRAGFDDDTASNIGMVAREAAANAVVHGNKYDPAKQVSANFEASSDSVYIRLSDQGPGFDSESIPDPLAPENLLRSSGRGVFLMRAFMDEVNFRQLDPGTEITLVKRRNP